MKIILPKKWCVRIEDLTKYPEYAISRGFDLKNHYVKTVKNYLLYSDDNTLFCPPKYLSSCYDDDYKEITLEEFELLVLNKTPICNYEIF